jgi:hypothetical protein
MPVTMLLHKWEEAPLLQDLIFLPESILSSLLLLRLRETMLLIVFKAVLAVSRISLRSSDRLLSKSKKDLTFIQGMMTKFSPEQDLVQTETKSYTTKKCLTIRLNTQLSSHRTQLLFMSKMPKIS